MKELKLRGFDIVNTQCRFGLLCENLPTKDGYYCEEHSIVPEVLPTPVIPKPKRRCTI